MKRGTKRKYSAIVPPVPKVIKTSEMIQVLVEIEKHQQDPAEVIRIISRVSPDIRSGNGDTLLICAVRQGRLRATQLLVNAGTDMEVRNKDQMTALQVAVS